MPLDFSGGQWRRCSCKWLLTFLDSPRFEPVTFSSPFTRSNKSLILCESGFFRLNVEQLICNQIFWPHPQTLCHACEGRHPVSFFTVPINYWELDENWHKDALVLYVCPTNIILLRIPVKEVWWQSIPWIPYAGSFAVAKGMKKQIDGLSRFVDFISGQKKSFPLLKGRIQDGFFYNFFGKTTSPEP